MKRNRIAKRAFTLIELLVVIAIIAILAAILFPVFAQAKLAAKSTVSISNMKQLATGMLLYAGDVDDSRQGRNIQIYTPGGPVTDEYNWKQVMGAYVKSTDMYRDPANSASKFLDLHSDPVARQYFSWHTINLPKDQVFMRSYAYANSRIPGGFNSNGFDLGGSYTSVDQVANVFNIVETKDYSEDKAAWSDWTKNVDDNYSYIAGGAVKTGLQWANNTDKWSGKAQAVAFMDGHAKRAAFSQTCANQAPGELDAFNITADVAPSFTTGWDWAQDSTKHWNYCANIPSQYK